MLRTSIAAIAIVLLAGAAQAAPNDATSENDAIQLEENTLPGGNEPSTSMGAEPGPGGGYELKQLDEEKDD